MSATKPIYHVPTTVISGFLGVGKTTAILDLFTGKPEHETWAVLVNEFGKIGIDGEVYEANGILVKQIPGGCMCCAQGLPLQVSVNRLLRETRPDRLLIESSGVGHPAGVLKTLQGEGFNDVLELKAGICLLDPETLLLDAYRQNDLFREQLQLADILVANKIDLASVQALQAFHTLCESFSPAKQLTAETSHGRCKTEWLDIEHRNYTQTVRFKAVTEGDRGGWQTYSFEFSDETVFDYRAVKDWLAELDVTRLKGFIRTAEGNYLINATCLQSDMVRMEQDRSNLIEVIDQKLDIAALEQGLEDCIL